MNNKQLRACTEHMVPAWHLAAVRCLPVETLYLRDQFFPGQDTFATPEVKITRVSDGARPLGFFTCECATARPRQLDRGYTVETFEPPSIKEKMIISPCEETFDYMTFDEDHNSPATWAQRFEDATVEGDRQMSMARKRREEWMAAQALVKGEYTVEGHQYPKRIVGFERDHNLTGEFIGKDAWDHKSMTVMRWAKQLAYIARMVSRIGCAKVDKIVLGSLAAECLICLDDWMKYVCCDHNNGGIYMPANFRVGASHLMPVDGVQNLGDVLSVGVNLCIYDEWYDGNAKDENGMPTTEPTPYVPPNGMLVIASGGMNGGNSGLQGRTLYGAIRDVHAIGMGPRGAGDVPEFFKSDVNFDLGCYESIMASKPLIVPYNINASAFFTVCSLTDEYGSQMQIRRESIKLTKAQKEAALEERVDQMKEQFADNYARTSAATEAAHQKELLKLQQEAKDANARALAAEKAAEVAAAKAGSAAGKSTGDGDSNNGKKSGGDAKPDDKQPRT